jgi:predicted phosphodiesterase
MRRFLVLLLALPLLLGAADAQRFHFTILGDRTGGITPEIYGRVLREVALLQPDFVINVGDNIPGKDDSKIDEQWSTFRKIWARYPELTFHAIPGNHDIWSDASRAAFTRYTGKQPHYSFRYHGALFVVAETTLTNDLSDGELNFIEKALKANRKANPKFLFFHKPFWLAHLNKGDTGFRLHALARQYQVTAVISGHGHTFLRRTADGVQYMEVGSSGAGISKKAKPAEMFERGIFYHHVWVTVRDGKVTFAVKEIDGARGKGRMFNANDWTEKGPRFDPADPAAALHPET